MEENNLKELYDGLKKIAFGNGRDALNLILSDEGDIDPDKVDLFNVAEIKKDGKGGICLKFYDKIKAFEILSSIGEIAGNTVNARSFYDALSEGAVLLKGEGEEEE